MKKATSKNIYHPQGSNDLSKWRVTTNYNAIKSHGRKWSCTVEKRILNEWKYVDVDYEMGSEKECLKWAEETVIMMHGIKLKGE